MEFNPNNNIVRLCLQGMAMEESGRSLQASKLLSQAWDKATNDFEKFIAHYVLQHQKGVASQLKWLEIALKHALKVNDDTVPSTFPSLYSKIADCYESLGNHA